MTNNPQRAPLAKNPIGVATTSSNIRSNRVRTAATPVVAKRAVHTTLIDDDWDSPPAAPLTSQSGARRIETAPTRTSPMDAQASAPKKVSVTQQSGSHQVAARPPRTSLIDTEWDLDESAAPEATARAAQSSIIDLTWDELQPTEVDDWDAPVDARSLENASPVYQSTMRPAQSSAVDLNWDDLQPTISDGRDRPLVAARAPRTSLIDTEWDAPDGADALFGPEAITLPRPIVIADAPDDLDPVITFVELDGSERLRVLLLVHGYE